MNEPTYLGVPEGTLNKVANYLLDRPCGGGSGGGGREGGGEWSIICSIARIGKFLSC